MALTSPRDAAQHGQYAVPAKYMFPVAANVQLIPNGLVALVNGFLQEASATNPDAPVVGLVSNPSYMDQLNNVGGAAGAFNVEIKQGVFDFLMGAGADAITLADVGNPCYVIDDQTVGRTRGVGVNRPRAGRIVSVDPVSGQVEVLVGFTGDPRGGFDIELIATNALAQGQIVIADVNNAGQVVAAGLGVVPLGVVQNAPAAGGYARVRVAGIGVVKTNGAQAIGDLLESTAGGVSKVLVALSDAAGAPGGALVGIALSAVGAAGLIEALIIPGGGVPGTAA